MCGIVGYIGEQKALPIILEGLKKLEYRGYDSTGVAVIDGGATRLVKSAGRIAALEAKLNGELKDARVGIGHTRWATHGRPSDENAHPHVDCTGQIVVIHNGIIENYLPLRRWLQAEGHQFRSETDTEVIPHLLEHLYQGDLEAAVRQAVGMLQGAYALAVLHSSEPDKIVAVRLASPLVIGLGDGENFLASDIPALLRHTRRALVLDDGEMAILTRTAVTVKRVSGEPADKAPLEITWDAQEAEKGGYAHFMLKEIYEQPQALQNTLRGRISPDGARVVLREAGLDAAAVQGLTKVAIVACGTSAHAGLVGKALIEKLARIPVEWDLASEYRYRDPMVDERTLCVVVSQSGETADTLAALREAKGKGARTLAISNVVGSSLTREADWTLHTWAGPEISVASTKAYTTQVVALTLLAVFLAQQNGRLSEADARTILDGLQDLPAHAGQVLAREPAVAMAAQAVAAHQDVFFIGRGLDYAVAMEGQLKLKEISYIHAEAYAAGELKHGTLALITDGVPVIALATQEHLHDKTLANIQEVKARGAEVIAIAVEGDGQVQDHADKVFYVPRVPAQLTPVLAALYLQLLAYHAAVERGTDVDQPRNLAKSVTVE